MILGLLIVGMLLTSSAVKGTEHELGQLVTGDFTSSQGAPSFLYWGGSIAGIGALGYVPGLQRISNMLLLLLLVVLLLSDNGVFTNFVSAIENVSSVGPAGDVAAPGSGSTTNSNNSGPSGPDLNSLGPIGTVLGGIASIF